MIKFIVKLLKKYRELIFYGIFGLGATFINIAVFYIFESLLNVQFLISNIIAWIFAFIFAFITNKLWVFNSRSWKEDTAVRECLEFLCARIATLFLDTVLMWGFIQIFCMNEIISKIIVNIVVILVNYMASKFWIFRN